MSLMAGDPGVHVESWGVWSHRLGVAAICLGKEVPPERLLLHEVTHALIALLSSGFAYPHAVDEGYARLMEYMIPDMVTHIQGGRRASAPELMWACWTPEQHCTIEQLMCYKRTVLDAFLPLNDVAWRAFHFLMFLSKLQTIEAPIVQTMLYQMRDKDLRGWHQIAGWLAEVTGKDIESLETEFREYCAAGHAKWKRLCEADEPPSNCSANSNGSL